VSFGLFVSPVSLMFVGLSNNSPLRQSVYKLLFVFKSNKSIVLKIQQNEFMRLVMQLCSAGIEKFVIAKKTKRFNKTIACQ